MRFIKIIQVRGQAEQPLTPWITDDEFFSNSGAKTFSLWNDRAEINQLATFYGLNIRTTTK